MDNSVDIMHYSSKDVYECELLDSLIGCDVYVCDKWSREGVYRIK